jgi:hypothetical protein
VASNKKSSPTHPYKYAKELTALDGCPFDANAAFAEEAFRIVQSDLRRPDNFLPAAAITPGKFAHRSARCQCKSWALSMFERREQLRAHILKVEESAPLFRKLVGDHGVRLKLSGSHGRRTGSDRRGHFSFWEFVDFDASKAADEHFPLFP